MAFQFGFSFFWYFCDISFHLFKLLCWLRITDEGSDPEMRIWSLLLMKSDLKWCIHLCLFIFQPLHSQCHCWWTRESLMAHAAKFYSRLQLIRSVSRASTFSMLKFIEILIFGVYSPSLLASVCFGPLVISLFNFFSYFLWLRITDDVSVPEMRIWSISLSLFSYCNSHALTLNTFWGFCNIYAQSAFFVLAGGGGVNFNISSSLYFYFVIKFRLLLSICGLHFWCPLNLKMLPTPLPVCLFACLFVCLFCQP